ncbi:ATPase class I type 8B member 4, partial [Entomortierella lignicola]
LLFGGSSIAPSVRSFDPNRASCDGEENRQELYEVEFNVPPDPLQEEARRIDHTTWGRIRKVLRAGFPGRDLDPKTRKPKYKYPTNNIKTTKYTLVTFLPVNLLFQFKRFYNIYFLCAAIFVCAEPSLSPVTEILPLTLVLTITAIKDALEDYC